MELICETVPSEFILQGFPAVIAPEAVAVIFGAGAASNCVCILEVTPST